MAKKKVYTKESLIADAESFRKEDKGGFNKTAMTLDWMDNYVAKVEPETSEEWMDMCLNIPLKTLKDKDGNDKTRTVKNDGTEKTVEEQRKDIGVIREKFIAKYFPNQTDEAIEKRKEEEKKRKEKEKAEKEEMKNLSPEERFRKKMEKLKAEAEAE